MKPMDRLSERPGASLESASGLRALWEPPPALEDGFHLLVFHKQGRFIRIFEVRLSNMSFLEDVEKFDF